MLAYNCRENVSALITCVMAVANLQQTVSIIILILLLWVDKILDQDIIEMVNLHNMV